MTWGIGTVVNASSWDMQYLLQSGGPALMTKIIVIAIIFLRIVAIIWVAKDISYRTDKSRYQIACILLITLCSPVLGLPLYRILRPVSAKIDRLPRREIQLMNALTCYNCDAVNLRDHDYCVECGEPLKFACKSCHKKYCYTDKYCGACGTPHFDK